MAKRKIERGTTSVVIPVFVQNTTSTVGAGLTGLAYNTSGLIAYYLRDGDSAATQITLATMTAGTWATGGFVQVDATHMPGLYLLSLPNAALANGTWATVFLQGAANMFCAPIEIELDQVNYQDAVRFGLTSLPNVASGSAGALPTTGTGANQISLSAGGVTFNNTSIASVTTVGTVTNPVSVSGTLNVNATQIAGVTLAGPGTGTITFPNAVGTSTYAGGAVASVTAAVTVGMNDDKTGYSLTQGFPPNFASQSIDSSGRLLLQQSQPGVTIPTVTTLTNDTSGVTTLLTRLTRAILFDDSGYVESDTYAVQAGVIATDVWNALLSAHDIANTFGNYVQNISGGGGSSSLINGTTAVTITFVDINDNPVPGVVFQVAQPTLGAGVGNSSGIFDGLIDEGTYTLEVPPQLGFIWPSQSFTVTSSPSTVTAQAYAPFVPPTPATPGYCIAYVQLIQWTGTETATITVLNPNNIDSAWLVGQTYTRTINNLNGVITFPELPQGAAVSVVCAAASIQKEIRLPTANSYGV